MSLKKNTNNRNTTKDHSKSTWNNVYIQNTPLNIAFRALLNGPFLPRKPDIPCVEALRAYINIVKCQCVYKQFNFADIPYINNKTKKIRDPFIVNVFKWSPSRKLNFKIEKRQRELLKRRVYQTKASEYAKDALYAVFISNKPKIKEYNLFLEYLRPFEKMVGKFNVAKQVDEVIMYVGKERILRHLRSKMYNLIPKDEINTTQQHK